MASLPKLSLGDIKARIDERSYQRGERYFRDGAIFNPRRQGTTIKARCQGSQGGPYHLEVTFDGKRIKQAECSCPVGDGGRCKHVAALLLTWRARPEEFLEIEALETALERRSKPELIALIKRMLRREPDLESLLEQPPPGTKRASNPEPYRRQALAAFRDVSHDGWDDWGGVPDLEPIEEAGGDLLEQREFAAASAVFEGLLSAILDEYETINDEGELIETAADCVRSLGECLAQLKDDPDRREAILRVLFNAHEFMSDYGGNLDDVPELIGRHATAEERRTVAGWVREKQPKKKARTSDWGARQDARFYGEFLLALEGDELDDDAYLKFCRESGLAADLVDRLLKLGRRDEAVEVLKQAEDSDVLALADLFVHHKRAALAEPIVRKRAETVTYNQPLLDWLKRRAAARRDKTDVRALTEQLFRQTPSLEGYRELRSLTPKAEWASVRGRLLDPLTRDRDTHLLIKIALDEKEIDRALELVSSDEGNRTGLVLEVARAAEATRPKEAIAIYRRRAEQLIEARGRENYRDACRLLKTVRGLYGKLGEPSEWDYYVGLLRERNRSLRALMDEMTAAKL